MNTFPIHPNCYVAIPYLLGAGDVRFSLNGTTYQNNSIVTLEDIGEDDNALFCITILATCCRYENGSVFGNWFFPNGTRVPSLIANKTSQNFYREREQMVVNLNRRRGGEVGIYHCEIPDSMNVIQTIYIGVYSASTGEFVHSYPVTKVMVM